MKSKDALGQVAYEAWRAQVAPENQRIAPLNLLPWAKLAPRQREVWVKIAEAVVAAQAKN